MTSILTVITPAPTRDLTTLATVKDEMGITDRAADVRLRRWITEMSGFIETYCKRIFGAEQVREQFRDRGPSYQFFGSGQYIGFLADGASLPQRGDPVTLRRYPVSAMVSVVEDTITLVQDIDYEIDPERGFLIRLYNDAERPWSFQKLMVTYTGGYGLLDSLPYPLEQACLILIKHRWAARDRDPLLRQEIVPGVLEQQWWVPALGQSGLPPEVAELLDPFREVNV